MSNNSESFMDLPFIRNLAAYPERTSRQVEQIFSHALDQTKNNSQSEQLQSLRDLNQTNKEIAKWISEILLSNQRWYNNFSRSERDFYESDFNLENDVSSYAGDLSSAMQCIYGWKLPEWKSMIELWRQIWFNWKRTAVALAVHWWIDYDELSKMFHPDFVEYLYNWYSSQEVSQIQQQQIEEIYWMQKKQSDLLSIKRSIWENESERLIWINRQFSDLSANMTEINKHLLSWDEIKLLDFWLVAKQQSLWSLISNWIIDQKSLELLIRNQKVDWNMALDLSRIVVKDKKWWLKPLVELDGIMWIMQETRINRKIGNISILQRKKINENLENIDDSINEWFEEVSQQIWIWNKKLDKIDKSLHQLDKSIIDAKIETNENLMKINESMYTIWSFTYGINFPEERKLIDLVKDFWPEGKKTLLSLYAKWIIDESSRSTLWQLFSPAFFNSLSTKGQNVLDIQNDRKNKIVEIQNQIKNLWKGKSPDIEKKRNQYQSELDGLQQTVMNKEDLEYRDIYQKASEANNINELIEWGFLDDDVLELLIRNQKLDGQTSLDLARIINVDENGINPKLTLDGDVWRWQQLKAQTIQWNIALKQRWMMLDELGNVNENLWIIWHGIQRANFGIDRANENLELIEDGIQKTNWWIDQLNSNVLVVWEELQTLNLWVDNINYNLEYIDWNLEYIWDQMVQTNEWIGMVNKSLWFIWWQVEQTNKQINISNQFLSSIANQSIQTNEFLFDILNVWIINSDLLEESNFLSKISNQLLLWLSEQINFTWEQIIQVLGSVWNIIVNWFNENFKLLENLNNFSKWILNELYRQWKILESINDKMDKPLDIQANENFKYGMELLELSNSDYLYTEYSKDALKSFKKWINLNPTHLYNLYGAGISASNLGKYKESCLYLQKSYGIAIKQNEYFLAKNISLDIAKICAKNLKMDFAKYWIDKSIVNDKDFVEPYLLKARITKILWQEQEFNVLINIIASQITDTLNELKFGSNYDDVLKYTYDLVSLTIDNYIIWSNFNEFATLIPRLYEVWYDDLSKKATSFLLFNAPKKLLNVWNVKNIIESNKQHFKSLYLDYVSKKMVNWVSDDLFIQAYLWYWIVNFGVIEKILNTWFWCDSDFIAMRESISVEEKKKYRDAIKTKIDKSWTDAKNMFKEYVKRNPYSLFCI